MAVRSPLLNIPSDLARTLRGAFDFSGRSRRTEVWTYLIFGNWAAALILWLLLKLGLQMETEGGQLTLLPTLITLAYLAPIPALIARRSHDIGWTGWTALLVPFTFLISVFDEGGHPSLIGIEKQDLGLLVSVGVAGILLIILIALLPPKGKAATYGPDPRPNEVAEA